MISQEPIQRFRRQMSTMHSMANFLVTLGSSIPPTFTLIKPDELDDAARERWGGSIQHCAEYVRSVHPTKDLYVDGPSPIPVDPNCAPLDFSDHLQDRLGKNHPLFDFIHAPFTRPLGTQFTLIFVTYAWDAYDTFISSMIKLVCKDAKAHDSDGKLNEIGLLPSNEEIANEFKRLSPDEELRAEDVPAVIRAAKLLRNSFSHHAGDPKPELKRLVDEGHFHSQLIRFLPDGEFEVVLPMSRLVSDVIIAKVELIQSKAEAKA